MSTDTIDQGADQREAAVGGETSPPRLAVSARGISKMYERGGETVWALRPSNFSVTVGDFVAVLGPSGSGKSTLLNVLSGLAPASAGTVIFGSRDLSGLRAAELAQLRRFEMGFVFQQFYLLQHLTALENVLIPLSFQTGLTIREQRQRAGRLLASVGLAHRQHHMPGELSGGEQQRVAIARALANDPAIIFADEPTGNLDRHSAHMVMELLLNLNEDLGATIVAVTHDQSFQEVAKRTVQIEDGDIVSDQRADGRV